MLSVGPEAGLKNHQCFYLLDSVPAPVRLREHQAFFSSLGECIFETLQEAKQMGAQNRMAVFTPAQPRLASRWGKLGSHGYSTSR